MVRFKKWYSSFTVLATVGLGHVLSTKAVEPEDILAPAIGPVVILPHASLTETYNDNVFYLTDENKVDDFVTSISPGVSLQYGQNLLDSNFIGLDYTLTQNWYAENSEINSDNHAVTFAINYQKEGKFKFRGTDSIRLDNTILSGRERSSADYVENISLVERSYFNDQYRFDYILSPKTSLYSSLDYDAADYDEKPHYYNTDVFGGRTPYALYDVSSLQGALGFGWQAFPKVKLYGGGFYGRTSVERNLPSMEARPDSDFGGFFIEADGDFGEKLTGRIRGGYQTREFDGYADKKTSESHNLPVFQAALEYQFTPKRKGTLAYTRTGRVSVESPDWAYSADLISLNMTQEIGTLNNLFADAQLTYELDDYDTRDRQDQRISANAGLTYYFNSWSKFQATYNFTLYDSNQGNIDYTVNRFMLSLSVGY